MSTYEALSLMIAFGILVATIISGKLSFYNFGVKWNKTAKVWQPFFQTQNLQGEGWRANIRLSLFLYYTTNKRHLQTAF